MRIVALSMASETSTISTSYAIKTTRTRKLCFFVLIEKFFGYKVVLRQLKFDDTATFPPESKVVKNYSSLLFSSDITATSMEK